MSWFTVIAIIAALALLGVIAYAAYLGIRERKEALNERERRRAYEAGIDPEGLIATGGLLIGSPIEIDSETYRVIGIDRYHETLANPHGDGVIENEDDYWYDVTVKDDISGRIFHLSCEEDDEGIWTYYLFEAIDDVFMPAVPEFQKADATSEEGALPEKFSYLGMDWEVDEDENDVTFIVHSSREGRSKDQTYAVQSSTYIGYDADGNEHPREISIETWITNKRRASTDDKWPGISVTIGGRSERTVRFEAPKDKDAA